MKFCYVGKDGGPESTVWGFWLIEIKSLFSIALLCFENGSRDAYHSHAFNSVSWVLTGGLFEDTIQPYRRTKVYWPSLLPVITRRQEMHKVSSIGRSWVLTFRGPWRERWQEYLPLEKRLRTLTHGRIECQP